MFAYFDCFSGISGDMTLGALIDLGVPVPWLAQELNKLPVSPFQLGADTIFRHGLKSTKITIQIDDDVSFRNYAHIKTLVQDSPFSENVKKTSLSIFKAIAGAESKIHGCPVDEVHFHEVGSLDAIIDVVGTALAIEFLEIDEIGCSKIPLGNGFVPCQHGILPIPAPATVELLTGFNIYGTTIEEELVTPTGAAILKGVSASCAPMPDMIVEKIGYGAGTRELASQPNLLRVLLGNRRGFEVDNAQGDVHMVEASIDDMNPEFYGFLLDRLFEDGALDVYFVPIYMKKNRPATMVQTICHGAQKDIIIQRILRETTTIGVRTYPVERFVLERETEIAEIPLGKVTVKKITTPTGSLRYTPEFEDCKTIALKEGLPLQEVYRMVNHQINKLDK